MLRGNSNSSRIKEYLWRMLNFQQMDFTQAMSEFVYLVISPREVIKTAKFRKLTKNCWARDDPAFVVLISYFIAVASLAYSISFGVLGVGHFLRLVVGSVLIEFIGAGLLVATSMWYVTNKFMVVDRVLAERQQVEWGFCWDIHCNGFFPLFILLYVVQYFLAPLLLYPTALSLFFGNLLYAVAFSYYIYVSFLGYSALPFLHDPARILFPIAGVLFLLLFSLLMGFRICPFVLNLYFNPA